MKLLGRRNGQYSHHLGGNVGVRVTPRVAIMSTTGEWPECDQGDEALLALASNEIMPGPVHRHQWLLVGEIVCEKGPIVIVTN